MRVRLTAVGPSGAGRFYLVGCSADGSRAKIVKFDRTEPRELSITVNANSGPTWPHERPCAGQSDGAWGGGAPTVGRLGRRSVLTPLLRSCAPTRACACLCVRVCACACVCGLQDDPVEYTADTLAKYLRSLEGDKSFSLRSPKAHGLLGAVRFVAAYCRPRTTTRHQRDDPTLSHVPASHLFRFVEGYYLVLLKVSHGLPLQSRWTIPPAAVS